MWIISKVTTIRHELHLHIHILMYKHRLFYFYAYALYNAMAIDNIENNVLTLTPFPQKLSQYSTISI